MRLAWERMGSEAEAAPEAPRKREPVPRRSAENRLRAEFDERLAEETRESFEAGRERAAQEGRQAEHERAAAAAGSRGRAAQAPGRGAD